MNDIDASQKSEQSKQFCPTRLLEDSPAPEDQLAFHEGLGPHERLAKAISELIQSSEEKGGKMIGVEGGWGSGKTTVINLIKKYFKDNKEITIFCFDAWAHEGDPLRRTYLESLIRHFQSLENWVPKGRIDRWEQKLLELGNKRKIIKTKTVPKVTTLGRYFSLSVFMIPLGSALLTGSLRKGVAFDLSLPVSWMFIFGLLFTSSPFFVLAWNWIRVFYKRRKTNSQFDEEDDPLDWAFLAGHKTEQIQDSTESPEPTSIEFEDDFKALMKDALDENKDRKAVLVFDNLDRVAPEQALTIWATLQTFLQDRSQKEKWFTQMWLVVPYDPKGLQRLWQNMPSSTNTSTSFIDKSIQIRFEVPSLILRNWKNFLLKLLGEALPKHIGDGQTVYHIFNICREGAHEVPTPRELKLFINQIGALHRQWCTDGVPLSHIAYFVILRRMQSDIRKDLLSGTIPDPKVMALTPENLRENLAGLLFNVEAKKGLQLLLRDPIQNALDKSDHEKINILEKDYQAGFWDVLEEVLQSNLEGSNAKFLSNSTKCLENSELFKNSSHQNNSVSIKNLLKNIALIIEAWTPFNPEMAYGVTAICRLISEEETSNRIIAKVRNTISRIREEKDSPPLEISLLIEGLHIIVEGINSIEHTQALSEPFTLPFSEKEWIEACPLVFNFGIDLSKLLKPVVQFKKISEAISAEINTGKIYPDLLKIIEVTEISPVQCDWTALAKAIEKRLDVSQNPNVQSDESLALLKSLTLLGKYNCQEEKAVSKRLANPGHFLHHLNQAQVEGNIECKAMCIAKILLQDPSGTKPSNIGMSDSGYDTFTALMAESKKTLVANLVGFLINENALKILFQVVDARAAYDPLILSCLRLLADSKPEYLFTSELVIKRWPELIKNLNEKENTNRFQKLILTLCENNSLPQEIQAIHKQFQPKEAELYLFVLNVGPMEKFQSWCANGLKNLSSQQWQEEFIKKEHVLNVLLKLVDSGMSLKLDYKHKDGLIEHAKLVLEGKDIPPAALIDSSPKIISALEQGLKTNLRKTLLDLAMDKNGDIPKEFYDMYGKEISQKENFNNDVVRKLFIPILMKKSAYGLQWVKDLLINDSSLLHVCGDEDSINEYKTRLQDEISTSPNDLAESEKLIAEIAELIGVVPPESMPNKKTVEATAETADDTIPDGSKERM